LLPNIPGWASARRCARRACPEARATTEDLDYLRPEKRLSNELACTIGCEPATRPSLGVADAAGASAVGFNGGWAAACLVSGFEGFGVEASGRGPGSLRLASITFGFAGIGWAVAVVSAKPAW
jgi:hypothetical protein